MSDRKPFARHDARVMQRPRRQIATVQLPCGKRVPAWQAKAKETEHA